MKLCCPLPTGSLVVAVLGFTFCGCAQSGLMTRPQPSGPDENYATFLSAAKCLGRDVPKSWNPVKKAKLDEVLAMAESLKPGAPEIPALRDRFQQALAVWHIRANRKATEAGKTLPETFVNSAGITMKLIQPGTTSSIEITTPYYIGVYEVTDAQWARVMGGNGGPEPAGNVSYNEATKFCQRLSAKEGITYSLPSEDQWEYACRAGTVTEYSFGDSWDEAASRRPNPWGLYDMHGNQWEWCIGSVLRGGSWAIHPRYCRAANRVWSTPGYRVCDDGFRVVVPCGPGVD